MAITSAFNNIKWHGCNTFHYCQQLAIQEVFDQCPFSIAGHTNTHTPRCYQIVKNNIFLRPEEAMFEEQAKACPQVKFILFLKKIEHSST